jgi:hypothetical protein
VPTFSELKRELTDRVTSTTTTNAAATAMADTLRDVAAGYLGGDLAMSGTGRAVTITARASEGQATIEMGGAWGLADGGRHRAVRAVARRRSAIRTPWGPRAAVRGSTWAGFDLTDRAKTDVFEAGKTAWREAVLM